MARFEWLFLELLLLAFLVYELVKVRRLIRSDREAKPREDNTPPP